MRSRTFFLFLNSWGLNFLQNECSKSSQIYLSPEKLRKIFLFNLANFWMIRLTKTSILTNCQASWYNCKFHDSNTTLAKNGHVCLLQGHLSVTIFCRTCMWPQATSEAITFEAIKIQTHSASQNDRLNLSFVKDKHLYGKKMARKGPTTVIYQYLSFLIRVYTNYKCFKGIYDFKLDKRVLKC